MMNRYFPMTCLAMMIAWLFLVVIPGSAMAEWTPNKDTDFQCDVHLIQYTDQVARSVNYDFSAVPSGRPLTNTEQIIYFDYDSVFYAPGHEGPDPNNPETKYKIQADEENAPASRLIRIIANAPDDYYARLGVYAEEGDFAWFPVVMGDTPSHNIDMTVEFSNFQNVGESQTGYHFELVAGGCRFTALWFTGVRTDGQGYNKALIFNGTITGSDGSPYPVSDNTGYPIEDIITGINAPEDTTVTLRLVIGTDNVDGNAVQGGRFAASYSVNGADAVELFDGSTLKLRKIMGYDGTYTDEYGVEHKYDEGDLPGDFAFPFISVYTSTYASGNNSSSKVFYDEHVGGACFVSESLKNEETLKVSRGPVVPPAK